MGHMHVDGRREKENHKLFGKLKLERSPGKSPGKPGAESSPTKEVRPRGSGIPAARS